MACTSPRDTQEYWNYMWKEGQSMWQKEGVTKLLSDNKEVITAGKSRARVFIPLCGKASELKWFYDLGHTVIGVEFVEDCVRSFFDENGLKLEEATCPIINCKILRTEDHRLQVFICDIFDFKRDCIEAVDIVWDRSGFTAVRLEDRSRYAAVVKKLLAPDFSYGMWTIVYDSHGTADMVGPRSAGESAIRECFGDTAAKIALVDSQVEERTGSSQGCAPYTFCLWHMTPPTP
ncbi:thiopurine S-methyltransferase-like [Dermacentor albipictus]|uniref:thiopurine S-methyltransferase-like n=1 Tax=Dermacentor albipictus TaxID=60249 RepID=UPI0038FCC9DC